MGECCSNPGKSWSYGERKKRTEVKLPITIICSNIQIILRGQDLGSIINVSIRSKEFVWEDRKLPCIECIEFPIAQWDNYVDKHDEPNTKIENRGPWCHQWTTMIGWDTSPIKSESTHSEPIVAWPDLLSCDAVGFCPTNPWEKCQDWEQIAR